jgi:hypothetical protein
MALWLWRRNRPFVAQRAETRTASVPETWHFAAYGLVVALLAVVVDLALTQLLLLQSFPGVTFLVQHVLIAFVFVCTWTAYAGVGRLGWIVGSLMLAMLWVTYNMYLGPRGLPLLPPTYSGFEDLWWRSFPGALVSALLAWWVAGKLMKIRDRLEPAALLLLAALFVVPADPVAAQTSLPPDNGRGLAASARFSGDGVRIVGADPVNMQSTQPMTGTIAIHTVEHGNRWSHIQNTDAMRVVADFSGRGGRYHVTIDWAMPRHPLGRYTTWNGVVYRHEMHGDTGIGTGNLPKMKPDIALWGWAHVTRDDQVISRMAPAHVMVTTEGAMPGVMLEIDSEDKALGAEPDGYITVMWHKVDALKMPTTAERSRSIVGWVVLLAIVALFGWLAWREGSDRPTAQPAGRA